MGQWINGTTGEQDIRTKIHKNKRIKRQKDNKKVFDTNLVTKLQKIVETGLLKMGSSCNCLNYSNITSTDKDRMIRIININNCDP